MSVVMKGPPPMEQRLKTRALDFVRSALWDIWPWQQLVKATVAGKSLSSAYTKFIPNPYQFKKGTIRTSQRFGLNWELDISQGNDWAVYFNIEEAPHQFLFSLANSGDTVLDIGANIGATCLPLAQRVGLRGHVVAFEPNPVIFARLERHKNLNNLGQLHIVPLALGCDVGFVELETPNDANWGTTRVARKSDSRSGVKMCTLDDFLCDHPVERVDIIKIDVEGFELNVLKGAVKTLQRYAPKLYVELNDELLIRQGANAVAVVDHLQGLGYKITCVQSGSPISNHRLENCAMDIYACK